MSFYNSVQLPAGRKRGLDAAQLGLGNAQDKKQRVDGFDYGGSSSSSWMADLKTPDQCGKCIKDLYIDFDKARVPQRRNLEAPATTVLKEIKAPIPGAWNSITKELVHFHERSFELRRRNREIMLREEISAERQGSNDVEFSSGWMRYLRLQNVLNSMGIIRSRRQRQIHEAFLMATVHHLWGDEWEAYKVQIMAKLKITKRKEQVMAVAPRREGKSWVMMMFCLALGLTIAGFTQALMAPSKRACKADMAILLGFLGKIPGGTERIVAHSEELLTLSATDVANEEVRMARKIIGARFKLKKQDEKLSGNNSTLQIFPSNERTSRGYTAKVTYMEEAAFMNSSYFDKVILHQAVGVEGNSLLAISSPDDEYNYYSELVDLKDMYGEPLFHVIILGMACQDCINKGIAEKCIHKLDELAAWKSIERYMMVSQVLSRKKEIMMREQQGLMVGKRQAYFDPLHIRLLFERPVYNFRNAPHVLHMAMDPSGGGTQSNYTISTQAFENGMSVICGLDASNSTRNNVIYRMASNHILALRRQTSYKHSLICLYIESNSEYFTADRWAQLFSAAKYQPLYVECAVKGAMYGVRTTPQNKPQYVLEIERTLIDKTLVFAREFVAQNEDFTQLDEKAPQKLELRDQLTHFSFNVNEPHDVVHGKFRFAFSGKTPGGTHKDDYLMCLGIGFHYSRQLRANPKFAQLAHNNGWNY